MTHTLNFAQPLWLWGLLLIPIGWGWSIFWRHKNKTNLAGLNNFIDQKLLPHILISASNTKQRNFGLLYSLLVFCIIMALANPRWSYKDLDAYQPTASMVILLDLAMSMNAADVSPSRIVRARQNIEDVLNLSRGLKIGLIGFAGNPHLISPITDDIQTLKTYIPALDTDLTNLHGNSLHMALRMGDELLANEPGDKKSILLVSDGNWGTIDISKELSLLNKQNIQVHVIGVGTATGAPFKTKSGALHKDKGKVVVSKLNADVLKNIAKQGHGIYTEAAHTDLGLRAILTKAEHTDHEQHIIAGKIRQWDDSYYLFLLPAAVLLLYLMRQRILYMFVATIIGAGLYSPDTYAFDVANVFKNSEQRGQQIYVNGDFKQAAETFNDPYHKGVALYRAGQFDQAEQQFNQTQRNEIKTSAMYNAGNSQMQQKKWRAAIKSYEAVLAIEPDNFAAQHNLEIARKMLAENDDQDEPDSDSDCECDNKKESENGKQDESDSKKGNQQEQNNEQNKEQNKKQDNQSQDNKQDNKKDSEQNNQQNNQEEQQSKNADQQKSAQDNTAGKDKDNAQQLQNLSQAELSEDEARMEQWLSRVDSDIKVFLKNKFYIEDVLSAQ